MASVPLPEQNFILGDPLSLERIRAILTRLEDTIIFSLIERAQFAHNPKAYRRGEMKELKDIGFTGSWLEWFLKETESFHGELRSLSLERSRSGRVLIGARALDRRRRARSEGKKVHQVRAMAISISIPRIRIRPGGKEQLN